MRPELKYGLVAGLGMSGWTLLEHVLGFHTRRLDLGEITSWGTLVILAASLYFLLRHHLVAGRRYWLPAWESVLYGALASLVAAMVFYIFQGLYHTFLNREWVDLYLEWKVAQKRAAGVGEEEIRAFARSVRWQCSPAGLAVMTLGLHTLFGGLLSAMLSLWLNWRHVEKPVEVD